MSDIAPAADVQITLTPDELRVLRAALRSFHNDFGHDERDVHDQIRAVLNKLPEAP